MAEDFTLLVGDVREQLATLPDGSVHCVVTSPPYWGLRDYGTGLWEGGDEGCDHKQGRDGAGRADGIVDERAQRNRDGAAALTRQTCRCGATRVDQQLGLEPTPELYVENLVVVFREVRRVLRRDGTCWLNIGDCYAASQGIYPDGSPRLPKVPTEMKSQARPKRFGEMERGRTDAEPSRQTRVTRDNVWRIKPKDLMGMPWRLAFALQADGWYLRSEIIWAKPNPMPESVTDRPTKSHEQVFLLTKSPRYFYDADAVREPLRPGSPVWGEAESNWPGWSGNPNVNGEKGHAVPANPAGRNLRSVWEIATQPYPEAHFATYPEELVRRCVLAGTSERGCCPVCGAPWERETETSYEKRRPSGSTEPRTYRAPDGNWNSFGDNLRKNVTTLGWRPTCDPEKCAALQAGGASPIPCAVLDPFLGSGTTALVARKHGRRCVGIELNPAYAELAERRNSQQTIFQEGVA